MVLLTGQKSDIEDENRFPDEVRGIKISQKAEKTHFLFGLHGSTHLDEKIASFTLYYQDGETRKIPLVYGRNITNSWFIEKADTPTDADVAWIGDQTGGVHQKERKIRIFRYTVNNPRPEFVIDEVGFKSSRCGAAPFLISLTFQPAERVYEWFDSIRIYNNLMPRSTEATPDQVDLTEYFGTCLDDDWFNHGGHDYHDLPKGLQTFDGVNFDVRGLIILAGTRSIKISGLVLPESIRSMPVNRIGKFIHFLHVSAFGACVDGSGRGAQIGSYILNYANGEKQTIPLVYGKNIMDWWVDPAEGHVSEAKEVWVGSNAATRSRGMQIRVIKYSWPNPLPDQIINSFDFVSEIQNSAPMLLAVTVGD
jgi:hypothetical protein